MKRWLLPAAGLALIVLTNAIALGGAAYNRAGEPDAEVQLSQRELDIARGFSRENSGVALQLRYRIEELETDGVRERIQPALCDYQCAPHWLDAGKLAELGFAPLEGAERQAREVLLVLEFDGPAYQRSLERARRIARAGVIEPDVGLTPAERLDLEEHRHSRLFVIDAGSDAAALRAKYPDRGRYILVPGLVKAPLTHADAENGGWIDEVVNDRVQVPATFRPPFAELAEAPPEERAEDPARFVVTLRYGRRLEPWLVHAAMVK